MSVLHPKAAGDGSKPHKAQPLIQMTGMEVTLHDGVELENTEAMLRGLFQAVKHQLLPDMKSAAVRADRIAGVADVPATPDIVGVKDVEADYLAVNLRYTTMSLGREESLKRIERAAR